MRLRFFAACSLFVLTPASVFAATEPSPIQTIYVIPSSHWDFGFVNTPNAVRLGMKAHLDAVMAACDADPQFRWTIESVWQLDAWLEQTKDQAQIEHMSRLLRKGQIELSAAYGSMHTEFMGTEELNRLVAAGAAIEQRLGVHPQVAMMDDAPGFTMRLPQVLARSGIRYFLTGSNTGLGGGAALWPGKVPFYWKSPDGSGVLVWQTQGKNGGYTEGMADYYLAPGAEDPYEHTKFYPKEWNGLPELEIMQRGVSKLLKQYTNAGYRQSALAVFFMHDAIGPNYERKYLLPSVRAWNAAGKSPHIVVATPSEYFAYLESHAAKTAPVYMGDWSGLWPEVKVNSPAMSADARFLQQRIPETETLWSLLKMQGLADSYPQATINTDYTDLFRYDEHNGAGQGGWPDVMTRQQVLDQNQEYSDWLRSGTADISSLFHDGIVKLTSAAAKKQESERTIVVYNPRSWTRSPLAKVANLQGNWIIRDAKTGSIAPSQRLASGELCFEANDIPPVGYRTYVLEPGHEQSDAANTQDAATMESPYFRVELDPATGNVLRITDLRAHRILVDEKNGGHAAALTLNDAVYALASSTTHIALHRSRGAVADQIVITRQGSLWPQTVITLPQNEPVIRFDETLDRSRMPFVAYKQPRNLYAFAFDFSMQGNVEHWVDNGEGLYRFPEELLPGARKDGVVPRHTLVWSDSHYQVMLTQKQTFFDRLRTPTRSHDTDGVLIDAMIKSDQAKTKDAGVTSFETYEPSYPSTYNFSFALTAGTGPVDAIAAHRFLIAEDSDAVELSGDKRPKDPMASLLSLSAPNVVVEALRPSSEKNHADYLLRLQEIAGKPADVRLHLPLSIRSISETTLSEDRVLHSGISADAIHLSPYQTLTLHLSVAKPAHLSAGEGN